MVNYYFFLGSQPNYTSVQFSAGYYNPVPQPQTDNTPNFVSNGFSSFIGSNFNLEVIRAEIFVLFKINFVF